MKKLMMAVIAVCAAVGAFAESTDDYVQSGLIACWDGFENGGRLKHESVPSAWADVQGGFEGEGNVDKDPLLYAPTHKRAYHLRNGSPCAGTGDGTGWPKGATDLDGLPRTRGSTIDMGCYSYNVPGFMLMLK